MKRKIGKIITFISFLIVMTLVLSYVYGVIKWKDTTGGYVSSIDQLYNTDKGLIDVAFVGSSHTYCAMLPSVLWDKYGIASFDMSVSGQDKISALYEMREFLKTQRPKVVVIDAFALSFDRGLIEGNDYRNLLSMRTSANTVKHVLEFFKDRGEGMDKVPDYLTRWPIVHTRYRELQRYDFVSYYPNEYARGEGINFHVDPSVNLPYCGDYPFEPVDLSEKNVYWLESLKEMSEEFGFEIAFMVIPYKASEQDQIVFDSASVYAREQGWDFLDFNRHINDLSLVFSEDFADEYHLNSYGADKFSNYMADYINGKFELPDHRGDERYHQWDMDSEYVAHLYMNERLNGIEDLFGLMGSAAELDDRYVMFFSAEFHDGADLSQAKEALKALGAGDDQLATGGLWRFQNGKVEKIYDYSGQCVPASFALEGGDSLDVMFNGNMSPGNLRIGYTDRSNLGNTVSLFIYDEMLREVTLERKYQ